MPKRKLIDPVKIGAKGGRARAANLTEEELRASGSAAARARWDAYYEAHPDKLREKQERERKGRKGVS